MKIRNTSILNPIKRIIYVFIIAIFATLLLFIYIQNQSSKKVYEDKQIINVFGKQRMLIQLMSKDANRVYGLMYSLEKVQTDKNREEIKSEIESLKNSMVMASGDFTQILNGMNSGYLQVHDKQINLVNSLSKTSDLLNEINKSWDGFSNAISAINRAEKIDYKVNNSINYINDHNMDLLEHSDGILSAILSDSIESTIKLEIKEYVAIAIVIIGVLIALFHLMRYIVLPFNHLYQGISELGITTSQGVTKYPTTKKVTQVVKEINDMFLKFNDLKYLIENINNNDSFIDTLNFINKTFSELVPYNYIGIALFDEEKKTLSATYGVSDGTVVGLPDNMAGKDWPVNDTSLGKLLNNGKPRIINNLEKYVSNRALKPYNKVILDGGIRASITLPLTLSGKPIGVIFFSSTSKDVYKKEHINVLQTLANSIAISFHQNIYIDGVIYSSILALANLAEARDEETGEHLERMKLYSRLIAECLHEDPMYEEKVTLEYIQKIERFSPLHDIGKVGIRDDILLKPGKLTRDEFSKMKKHTTFGAQVLMSAESNIAKHGKSLFGMGIKIAQNHHEKWDGGGYPGGKKGEEIPLCARIVAVADVFDALTSKRPYKEEYSLEYAFSIISEGRGKHFDPRVVDAFLEREDEIVRLYNETRPVVA
ncbi:MAG: HD domain-containing protein [Clostridiales bacterium]|nr:HD domain-containing protein [Clostridiales bacterium]